ncbi:ABC transporter substrate-binding protein [Pseudomonas putida]|uniref:ABC transporter substrate-binding protein n=1 Tax=Pseudomonas putida TaxID=303 RepID=UPI003905B940
MTIRSSLGLLAITLCIANTALADGDAPQYGHCPPSEHTTPIKLSTVQADTLTLATVLPNPGWYNGNSPASTKDGFEYCMAANIAQRAGLKSLRIINLAWDQYISGTARGYDIAIAATTITEARKRVFNFSRPYYSSNLAVAVKKTSKLSNSAELKEARIGVLQGNIGGDWTNRTLNPTTPAKVYQSQPDLITALIAGHIDAVITDAPLILSAIRGSRGAVTVVGQFELDQGYGIITPKNSVNTEAVDSAVAAMIEDGTLNSLATMYLIPIFGIDPKSIPVWQLP